MATQGLRLTRRAALVSAAAAAACAHVGQEAAPAAVAFATFDLSVEGRSVPVRVAGPTKPSRPLGYVVFSHGANSNNALYDRFIGPLAAAGFVVVAPTHVDAEINPDRTRYDRKSGYATRLADLAAAAGAEAAAARALGLPAEAVQEAPMAVAGHSYGALLALQLVGAGARAPNGPVFDARNPRFKAAIALSPPGPLPSFLDAAQFDTIAAPILLATGHKDVAPGFVDDWRARLAAQERSPALPACAAVFPDADHYFGGLIGRFEVPGPPQEQSLAVTIALSAAFLRAHVLGDADAPKTLAKAARADLPRGLDWRVRA
jgi:dienelactone hydrolase